MQLWHISCREIVLITPPSRNKLLKLHPPPFVPYTLEGAIAMIAVEGRGTALSDSADESLLME